jgi:hypothetical protein
MIRTFVAVAALAASGTVFAASASITSASAGVMVNQGNGFSPAQVGQLVNTGDRILVPAGASSSISFDDGCSLQLPSDALVTVPATSTCAGATLATQRVTPAGNTAVGTRAYAQDSWWGWAALGGIALITAYEVATSDNDDEDDGDTVSP